MRYHLGWMLIVAGLATIALPLAACGYNDTGGEHQGVQAPGNETLNQEESGGIPDGEATAPNLFSAPMGPASFAATGSLNGQTQGGTGAQGFAFTGKLSADFVSLIARCVSEEESNIGSGPDTADGASAGPVDDPIGCITQLLTDRQTATVTAFTAPTAPVDMTPEEIREFTQLPSVKSGEIPIPALALTEADGPGGAPKVRPHRLQDGNGSPEPTIVGP